MSIAVAVDIPAPRPVVWDEVSDLASHVEWMADAESIEFASDQTSGVGTVMVVETTIGPLRTTDVMVVTEWIEGERIGVRHIGLVEGSGVFKLSDTEDGTRFEWEETLEFPWYVGGPAAAIAASPVLWAVWTRNLNGLRRRFATD